jgi:hypothetical protein
MVVRYVDEVGIAYANESDLQTLVTNLTKCNLQFTKEGTFTNFLGIKFVKDSANNIAMMLIPIEHLPPNSLLVLTLTANLTTKLEATRLLSGCCCTCPRTHAPIITFAVRFVA